MPEMSASTVPAIVVDGVSKTFEVPRERVHTLKERALHPFRRVVTDKMRALDDVSAAIEPGEFFGIVGRNGSGKSTLLKCLAGIYGVDSGRIYVNGQMSTFIELGVGFNMDLAAYDNVVLNATMLGLSPREARRRFDRIIEFAELEEFVELKVKNYSSGMLVRLAFSVMIQVDAEILLIDEVLAVGDAAFQQKCFDEFVRIRERGSTVILVTHDMSAVSRFCDRALLLEKGRVVEVGEPEQIGQRYLELNFSAEARAAEAALRDGQPADTSQLPSDDYRPRDRGAEIVEGWLEDENGRRASVTPTGQKCAVAMRVVFRESVVDPLFALVIQDDQHRIFMDGGNVHLPGAGRFEPGDEAVVRMSFMAYMAPGRYHVTLAAARPGSGLDTLDRRDRLVTFMATAVAQTSGMVVLPFELEVTRTTEKLPQ
jgi:ABC-type polysaccharide/polyol phosphate transport system ATPase subunit